MVWSVAGERHRPRAGQRLSSLDVRLDRLSRRGQEHRRRATCLELGGDGVTPVANANWTVDQTSHRLTCDALRRVLRQVVQAGPGAVDRIGSIRYRALAVLYTLLLDHLIDQRGRCRSCRRPGAMIGLRRRPCRIHIRASYWLLRQPDEALLLSHLAGELEQGTAPSPDAASPPNRSSLTMTAGIDPSDTDVLPRVMGDPRADPSPTPAVPSPIPPRGFRRSGRPDQDHGGIGG